MSMSCCFDPVRWNSVAVETPSFLATSLMKTLRPPFQPPPLLAIAFATSWIRSAHTAARGAMEATKVAIITDMRMSTK